MSTFLDGVVARAQQHPERVAFSNSRGEQLTFGQLDEQSSALAVYLAAHNPAKNPVALYGHKEAGMVVGMFACMKAGCAYVPIDVSFPQSRIDSILVQLPDPIVLCAEPLEDGTTLQEAGSVVSTAELASICAATPQPEDIAALEPIEGDDAVYILFTSGSTGTPKGVIQRAESIDLTSKYFSKLMPEGEGLVCFNRAPFSFDLSIFDFLMSLPNGHSMFALEKETEASLAATFEALRGADISVFVSTPSFLTMCLSDPSFNEELLPQCRAFIMCGETLHNATARKCAAAFPNAVLVNMYGPSETCGAVTDVAITPEMASADVPLPVGAVSPYSEIHIVDPDTLEEVPCGEHGEILILGPTAALGYHELPEKTAACFFERANHAGMVRQCYRTGDEGFLSPDGQLHYIGRYDLQLKVNGYRIELGDIEENLNALPQVAISCVVPVVKDGVNTALAAHIVCAPGIEGDRHLTKLLKEELKERLPEYMVPRTFKYHDELPSNVNGKIDRKVLQASVARS